MRQKKKLKHILGLETFVLTFAYKLLTIIIVYYIIKYIIVMLTYYIDYIFLFLKINCFRTVPGK